jgi:2-keto-4-pentenoate hydratase/2-oxohepta-3-ene-1,7-dioic acid hydratase in catechol pathway
MDYKITQVIGCAYTYRVSRAVRSAFSEKRKDHSSHQGEEAFSYFRKVDDVKNIVQDGGKIKLRKHPKTGEPVDHWYEAELAIILGENHKIVGYMLGNDFTAAKIEFEKATEEYDPTYYGKVWKGSCSLGKIVPLLDKDIEICLKIKRGSEVFTTKYNTSQRKRDFSDLPKMILAYREKLLKSGDLPESKRILLDRKGNLSAGTVILTGVGIITPKKWYAKAGDVVNICAEGLGCLETHVL